MFAKGDIDAPSDGGGIRIAPLEGGRSNVRGKKGVVGGVVDRDGRERGGGLRVMGVASGVAVYRGAKREKSAEGGSEKQANEVGGAVAQERAKESPKVDLAESDVHRCPRYS